MRTFSAKVLSRWIVVLSPLLLNALCERAVGPAPPRPPVPVVTACFGPAGQMDVRAFQNPDRPSSSQIRRVTWTFRVGCHPSTEVYTFGVRQNPDNRLELAPPPPLYAPSLVLTPSPEPFRFRIAGLVHGYWCVAATVELLDGSMHRVDEFFVNEYRSPPLDIGVIVSRQAGLDRADPWSADQRPCPLR